MPDLALLKDTLNMCKEFCENGQYDSALSELYQIESLIDHNKPLTAENITEVLKCVYNDLLKSGKIPSKKLLGTADSYILVDADPVDFIKCIESFRIGLFTNVDKPIDLSTEKHRFYYWDPTFVNQKNAVTAAESMIIQGNLSGATAALLDAIVSAAEQYRDYSEYWQNLNPHFTKNEIDRLITTWPLIGRTKKGKTKLYPDVTYIRDAKAHNAYLIDGNKVKLLLTTPTKLSYDEETSIPIGYLAVIYNSVSLKMRLFQLAIMIQQAISLVEKINSKPDN